jgi:hypothetical protein
LVIEVTDSEGNQFFIYPKSVSCKLSENAATEITLTFDNPEGLKTGILHFGDTVEIDDNL